MHGVSNKNVNYFNVFRMDNIFRSLIKKSSVLVNFDVFRINKNEIFIGPRKPQIVYFVGD